MKFLARWVAVSGLMLGAGAVQAATVNWVGSSGDWNTAADWSTGALPAAGDDAYVTIPGVTVTYINPSNNPVLSTLTVDATGTGATLDQGQDNLSADGEKIGNSGIGTFTQSGGTNTVSQGLGLGWLSGSSGTYTLSGTGSLSAGWEYIGDSGTGTFTQTGGTNTTTGTGNLFLGYSSGSTGTYTLSGGTLNVGGNITTGSGTSSLTIDGGTLNVGGGNGSINVGTFIIGDTGGAGNYTLSGTGSLSAGYELLSYGGTGAITQTGGTNTATNELEVGDSRYGSYTLSGGSLSAGAELLGYGSTGTFTQTGGTNTVTNELEFGDSGYGSYALSGGSLSAGYELLGYGGTGTFTQTGGTNTTSFSLELGANSSSSGSYTLNGGTLNVGTNITTGSGISSFTIDGGTLNVGGGNGSIGVGRFTVGDSGGAGSYTLSGTGSLSAGYEWVGASSTGSIFTQSGGTNTVTNELEVGDAGDGSYTLSGGSLSAGYEFLGNGGNGIFTQTGGTNTTSTFLELGVNGGGTYALSGGTLNVGTNITTGLGTSSFTIDGGTLNVGGGNGSIGVTTFTVGDAGGAGNYTLSGTGSLTASTINNNSNGNFTQSGGTEGGVFNNYGSFYYYGGIFNGTLNNNGTFSPSTSFTAGGGIVNNASLTLYSGNNLSAGGVGLTNNGTIGATGNVTLASTAGGFTNNGMITVGSSGSGGMYGTSPQSAMLTLNVSGTPDVNFGNIDLIDNSELLLASGTAFSNSGTISLSGGIVGGGGSLNNGAGGTISGPGSLTGTFTNSGGVLLVQNGTLNVVNGFANGGVVELSGLGANLAGGAVVNTGTVQGNGNVGNTIYNAGTVEALGGTLTLSGSVYNGSESFSGLMTASSGSEILVSGGMAINDAGVINLTGGTFDNNNHPLVNQADIDANGVVHHGQISGYGTIRTGGLTNYDAMTLSGGTTTVNGTVINEASGTITVAYNPAIFTGNVTNNGTIKITGTTVTYAGALTNNGAYISDPSTQTYTDLTVGTNGYLVGGSGDIWLISGNFYNNSTQNTKWSTGASTLGFTSGGAHLFDLAGKDFGATAAGYTNNFTWGILDLTNTTGQLSLGTGDGAFTDALYVDALLGASVSGDTITNITGNGLNLYYLASDTSNAYLGDKQYALTGGGSLIPLSSVPLPPAAWLFASGLIGMAGVARRRRTRPEGFTA